MSNILDKVREKFPAYEQVSDDDLTFSLANKYPQYLEADKDFKSDFDRINKSRIAGNLDLFKREQGIGAQPAVSALEPALPRPEPKPDVGALRPYQPPPRNLQTVLSGVGQPIEEPPDFNRLPLTERAPQTPAEMLQVPTSMPFPRMKGTGVVAGAEHFVADVADFMTSPAGFATLLAPETLAGTARAAPIGRGIATAYAADMARQMPETFSGIVDALDKGDKAEATRLLLNAGASALLIGGATKSNLKAGERYATQKRIEQESRQQQRRGIETQRLPTEAGGGNRPQPVTPQEAPNASQVETPPATPYQPFFDEHPVGSKVDFTWPEGGSGIGTVIGHERSGSLRLSVAGEADPFFK